MKYIKDKKKIIDKLPKCKYEFVFYETITTVEKLGSIYVDNEEDIKEAILVYEGNEVSVLSENPSEELLEFAKKIAKETNCWVVHLPHSVDKKIFDRVFHEMEVVNRLAYDSYRGEKFKLSSNIQVKRYDLDSAERIAGEVDPDFEYAWDSAKDFIEEGAKGYYIEVEGKLASTAWSYLPSPDTIEIAVATGKEFQKKGFATYVSQALINYSLDNNFDAFWSCNEDNLASKKLAEKLGFKLKNKYKWVII